LALTFNSPALITTWLPLLMVCDVSNANQTRTSEIVPPLDTVISAPCVTVPQDAVAVVNEIAFALLVICEPLSSAGADQFDVPTPMFARAYAVPLVETSVPNAESVHAVVNSAK